MGGYTNLRNDAIAEAQNESTEFLDYTATAIQRAQEYIVKRLDHDNFETKVSVALSAGKAEVEFPSGVLLIKSFGFNNGGEHVRLVRKDEEYLKDYWPVSASTGTPRYYSWVNAKSSVGGDSIVPVVRIAATPSSTFDGSAKVIQFPTTLTSASEDNYLTQNQYQLMFNTTMMFMFRWSRNWEAHEQYKAIVDGDLGASVNEARRARQDDGNTNDSPRGGNNLQKGSN